MSEKSENEAEGVHEKSTKIFTRRSRGLKTLIALGKEDTFQAGELCDSRHGKMKTKLSMKNGMERNREG